MRCTVELDPQAAVDLHTLAARLREVDADLEEPSAEYQRRLGSVCRELERGLRSIGYRPDPDGNWEKVPPSPRR